MTATICGDGPPTDRLGMARMFLLGGGQLTGAEWLALDIEERATLVYAGDALRRELAAMIGNAVRSERAAAEIASLSDGGAQAEAIRLSDLIREARR